MKAAYLQSFPCIDSAKNKKFRCLGPVTQFWFIDSSTSTYSKSKAGSLTLRFARDAAGDN